jgi:hypothetical protein
VREDAAFMEPEEDKHGGFYVRIETLYTILHGCKAIMATT